MDELKYWGQLAAWVAAVAGVVYAVYKGNKEFHESTKQRNADLRWKRANAAKELVSDLHHHRLAAIAVQIMDHDNVFCEYESDSKEPARFNFESAVAALKKAQADCDAKEAFVRDCFDWFFYYVDQIQHYIDRRLIERDDVKHIFRPYAKKLARKRNVHEAFMNYHDYDLALKFWAAYPEYNSSAAAEATASKSAAAG